MRHTGAMDAPRRPAHAGALLRAWRDKRRVSQMALALDAGVSTRHLSWVETGRARPSAELLVALAEVLALPLRERNALLLAAGHAPRYPETPLDAPDLREVRAALARLLDAHLPYPGIALDRGWNVVLANASAQRLVSLLPDTLRTPGINMMRASLHPQGFAAITGNFDAWGRHLLHALERDAAASLDGVAQALLEEVRGYPNVQALMARAPAPATQQLLLSCDLLLGDQQLSMFTTLATIGSPRDVTLAELTLELFYPADAGTAEALRALA